MNFPCLPRLTDASRRELDVSFSVCACERLFLDGVDCDARVLAVWQNIVRSCESGGSLARPISSVYHFILFYFMKKTKRETKSENVTTTGLVYGSPVRVQNAAPRVTRESRPQRPGRPIET